MNICENCKLVFIESDLEKIINITFLTLHSLLFGELSVEDSCDFYVWMMTLNVFKVCT